MDGYLESNLNIVLEKAIPNKWDALGLLIGKEGTGKSTLGSQICKKLDPNFNVDHIVFTPEQFTKALEELPEESAILWDEAITGANIGQHASEISQTIIQKLTMIRKRRLKILLCFPYLYMLNKYFVSRSLFSIYIYAKDFDKRGYGFFYSANQTEHLYNLMKEKFRYHYKGAINLAHKSFYFNFSSKFCADEKAYELKKDEASRSAPKNTGNIWKERLSRLILHFKDNGVKVKDMAEVMEMSPNNVALLHT